MARYHVISRWGSDGLELRACPNCTAKNCRSEQLNVFTDDELEQRDAEQYRNDIRLDYGV